MLGFEVVSKKMKMLPVCAVAALTFAAMPVFAQTQPAKPAAPAAKPAAPAAGQTAAAGEQKSQWIKICETTKTIPNEQQKEAKDIKVCMTQTEAIVDIISGDSVGLALRKVDGGDKTQLIATMPLGVVVPAGVQVKIDENEALKLPYTVCHRLGCVAEVEATDAVIGQMKKGKNIFVSAIGLNLKAAGVQLPLFGIDKAHDGAPVDNAKYKEERKKAVAAIMDYRNKLIAKAKEEAAAKKAGGAAPAPATAGAAAPAAPAVKKQ